MRYADDTITNEIKKIDNGEREIMHSEALELYLGGDNTNAEAWELLLDILNRQIDVYDVISEVNEHYKQYLEL